MLNLQFLAVFLVVFSIVVIGLMIIISWGYGFRNNNWTPFMNTVALLALLTGKLPIWHLFIANIGEATDASKNKENI